MRTLYVVPEKVTAAHSINCAGADGQEPSKSFNASTCATQLWWPSTYKTFGELGVQAKAAVNTVVVGVEVALVVALDVGDVVGLVDADVVAVLVGAHAQR